ncbi:leucyl aminopeptidase [Candidatus Uhrbacteria bacterium]|nr:leucyl aminopeptidase [Candidatus Uhrbacteria bacterium]
MDLSVKQGLPFGQTCDVLVLPVTKGTKFRKWLDPKIADQLEADGFEGNLGEWACLPTYGLMKARKIALLGVGERSALTNDILRRVGGLLSKRTREAKAKSVVTSLMGVTFGDLALREGVEAFTEGILLAAYGFHPYHKKQAEKHAKSSLKTLTVFEERKIALATYERAFYEAAVLSEATCLARDLVNTPSQDMYPLRMADIAKEIAAGSKQISLKLLDRDRMERLKMDAALAVARGSTHEPVGVHLVYKPKGKAKKRIAIVGKAVTFDSGGLSIKPADGMMSMKIDMAGGASVLGLFKALSSITPDVEVHGIFLAVENMPSGHAYRPGDVVRAMNGTTIEVLNTDAEGRVTLADALSYAATFEPDAVVDLATLTGACVVALGEEIAGAMGNDRRLLDRIKLASEEAGESLWELPMPPSYEDHVKSKIADVKNIGAKGQAGAISAALFLKHFIPAGLPWVHLDIAGPAYTEREARPDMPVGGTGFGVRTLVRYLQGL